MGKRKREVVILDDDDDEHQVVSESVSAPRSVRGDARRREKRVKKAKEGSPEVEEQKMDGDGAAELLSSINTGEGSSKDAGRAGPQANVDRDIFFMDLGNKRRATVRMFKGNVYVDIREFYGDDDNMRPGKKGIMLTPEQWKTLKDSVDVLHAFVVSTKK